MYFWAFFHISLKEKAHQAFLNLRKFINPSNQGIILKNVDQSCSKLRKFAQSLSKYTLPIQTTKSTQNEMKTILKHKFLQMRNELENVTQLLADEPFILGEFEFVPFPYGLYYEFRFSRTS